MKRIITTLFAVLFVVECAFGSAEIVKEKAKQQRDINNQQQGVTPAPASPSPSPARATSPAVHSVTNSPQQALIDRLQADLYVFKAGAKATDIEKTHVQDDLLLLSKGANKPSKATLAKFANDLATAFSEKSLTRTQMNQFTRDINIVVNSGFLTAERAEKFSEDAQYVLRAAGVSAPTIDLIGKDMGLMIVEIQKSKPKLYQ